MPLRLLHVSDLHFGRHSVAEQVEGLERMINAETFSAIVIAGDLTQRTRSREYARARKFVELADGRAP
ncbi:MAG TPA: metallophosphoesterase, partial [Gemmatimonadales bacterium]|nr:metallophosphoesterase [Gemmatimonadales bacterium]